MLSDTNNINMFLTRTWTKAAVCNDVGVFFSFVIAMYK